MCGLDLYQSQKEYGMWNNMQMGKIQCNTWTSELHELTQSADTSRAYTESAIYKLKKIYTTTSGASTWSPESDTPGTAMLSSSGMMTSKRRTQPAATGRITSVSEYSPVCCKENNHDPLPQKLLSQIKNYRLKSNSQDGFFSLTFNRGYTWQDTLSQRKLCLGNILKKRPEQQRF